MEKCYVIQVGTRLGPDGNPEGIFDREVICGIYTELGMQDATDYGAGDAKIRFEEIIKYNHIMGRHFCVVLEEKEIDLSKSVSDVKTNFISMHYE